VLEETVTVLGQRDTLERHIQPRADPVQGHGPQLEIVVLQDRIERVPELFDQTAAESQPIEQADESFGLDQGFGEPGGQLQVLGLGGDGFLRELDDRAVIGDFALVLPRALIEVVVLAARLLDLVVDGA
jgi:hypothetical protein